MEGDVTLLIVKEIAVPLSTGVSFGVDCQKTVPSSADETVSFISPSVSPASRSSVIALSFERPDKSGTGMPELT